VASVMNAALSSGAPLNCCARVPLVDVACAGRAEESRDPARAVAVFGPPLLIAEHGGVRAFGGAVNLSPQDGLLSEVSERRPVEVIARAARPHLVESLLVGRDVADVHEADNVAVLGGVIGEAVLIGYERLRREAACGRGASGESGCGGLRDGVGVNL